MMRFVYPVILLGLLFSYGCAKPKYNYHPITMEISEPFIDTINTAYVGDVLLKQGNYTEHDTIYLEQDQKIYPYTLFRGYYLKHGEDENTEFFRPGTGDDGGNVIKSAFADPWKSIQAFKNEQKLCVITVFNAQVCRNNVNFSRRKKPILRDNSFQQSLIYSGRVGKRINIGYREFSGNLARPAFSNDVEYDLTESNIIGYKGARIEVLEATNEYIKYRVIRNFNPAVL
jgi:hypothetical protein